MCLPAREPTTNLTVNILISEEDDRRLLPIGAELMRTAQILAGHTTGELVVLTEEDNVDERSGAVTATLQPGTGYTVTADAAQSQAAILVSDDEMPETPTGVGANGKVEYALNVYDTLEYPIYPLTPTKLEPYTPTVRPKVWWTPSRHAFRYEVLLDVLDCPNFHNDFIPTRCSKIRNSTTQVVNNDGVTALHTSPAYIPESQYSILTQTRVQVRAVDRHGNESALSEPAYMIPTYERPTGVTMGGGIAYMLAFTSPLFGYFNIPEIVNGSAQYGYSTCENLYPSGLDRAWTTNEIVASVENWEAIKYDAGKSMFRFNRIGPPAEDSCQEGGGIRPPPDVTEIKFGNDDRWQRFRCYKLSDGCYRNAKYITSTVVSGLVPIGGIHQLAVGHVMMRLEPNNAASWTSTAETHQTGCSYLEHIVTHEIMHDFGIGAPLFNLDMHRLSHPSLESDSVGSTMLAGHAKYCEPYPYDIAAVMAIYQHFDSAFTNRNRELD